MQLQHISLSFSRDLSFIVLARVIQVVCRTAHQIFPTVNVGIMPRKADNEGLVCINYSDVVAKTAVLSRFVSDLYLSADLSAKLMLYLLLAKHLNSVFADLGTHVLAAIESLLSCVVSDKMISDTHNSNTELIAQGAGNICSALFGGIPATGAIARTAANVKNGGRSPVSGIVHALVLLLVLVVLMPYAAFIPMPVIAAVLFMVAYNMSEWRHFVGICKKSPIYETLVLVLTFVLTVVFDLVVAIAVGLSVHYAIVLLKKCAKRKV